MKKIFSLFTAILFAGSMFAVDVVGTINFGSASGSLNVNNTSVSGKDSQDVTWTVTTTFDGETSFTPNAAYAQIGAAKKPAASITFTATLPAEQTIKAFSAKFGGFKDTAGDIALKVGDETVGTGALNAATDVTVSATKEATGTVLTVTVTGIEKGVKAYYISYTYEAEAPTVEKPAILGKAKFVGETEVTLSCETEGAKIYYTLDGEDPDAEATEYLGLAIKLTETTTVKAIAIKGADKSSIAEKTFTYYEAKTCAEAAALEANEVAGLNEVTVTYVNGGNIYVKDATGYELIYAYDFGLVAGDVVKGFIGKSSPYNGLPELKPEGVALADLDVVHGEAPAPEEIKAAPTADDINKYLIIKGVSVEGEFITTSATNLNATIGEETFVLRNNFKIAQTFEKDKKYDIVGTGAIYTKNDESTLQLYFISATESSTTALDNNAVETKAVKAIVNGQLLITRDGKTFNVLGTVVK